MSTIAVKSVRLANGIRLPYAESGYPGGTPVVFVHAVAESWRAFEPVLALLPFSLHGYAPTQRGHGTADKPVTGYRPEEYAADLVAFLDALEIERAVLVGGGHGGITARIVAGGHPDRVAGLMMIGTPVTLTGAPRTDRLVRAVDALRDPLTPADGARLLDGVVHGPVPEGLLETMAAEALQAPARVWQQSMHGLLTGDLRATLAGILVPTLAVWGDQDLWVARAEQQQIIDAIHGARLAVFENAGHAVHWEQPARTTEELTRFAAAVSATRG